MWMETDLILEAAQLLRPSHAAEELPGVVCGERTVEGLRLDEVRVTTPEGARAIGKPAGTYLTLTVEKGMLCERAGLRRAAQAAQVCLRELLKLQEGDSLLVVGLGNRSITADAIGPLTAARTLVTRHLVDNLPESFGDLRRVSAVTTGVLGTTGVESGELVEAVTGRIKPAAVVAVDALAARSAERLGTTIQFSDSGIVPGSGVGNARRALNRDTLGVPVIAVGVPTVIRAATLCADVGGSEAEQQRLREMVVTPKDIDRLTDTLSRAVGLGITLAAQEGMEVEEAEELLEG